MRSHLVRSLLAANVLCAAFPAGVLAAPPLRQVCGIVVSIPCQPTQTAKQSRERAAKIVMDGTAGITANGPEPAGWSPTNLHTQCEADFVPGRPKTHKVPADFHEALQNGIQGKVIFQIIVAADGTVENMRLVKSLDAYYGADRKAADYIRGTTFEPGTKAGVPGTVHDADRVPGVDGTGTAMSWGILTMSPAAVRYLRFSSGRSSAW